MFRFYAEDLHFLERMLNTLASGPDDFDLTDDWWDSVNKLSDWEDICKRYGLATTAIGLGRMRINGETKRDYYLYKEQSKYVLQTLTDELSQNRFICVPPQMASYLENPTAGWERAIEKFPSMLFDVGEVSLTFGVYRHTATVLHCMRVLEIGLTALGNYLEVDVEKRNWHNIIIDIEAEIHKRERNEKSTPELTFLSEAASQFMHFKEAWRNHAMHVRQTFDEQRARRIMEHVHDFMEHLATELHED